jgi:hypothetical protein
MADLGLLRLTEPYCWEYEIATALVRVLDSEPIVAGADEECCKECMKSRSFQETGSLLASEHTTKEWS